MDQKRRHHALAMQRIDLHKVSLEQIWQLIDFDNKGYIELHLHW